MRLRTGCIGVLAACSLIATAAAEQLPSSANTKSAVAFVANYDTNGQFVGWGTGFFVDEGIVITNKHVIEHGYYYRVYTLGSDDRIDLNCYRTLGRSGVKINRDDDVAYIRAYVDCPHGAVYFANGDPKEGDAIEILGYPQRESTEASLSLAHSTGSILGKDTEGPWMVTDAFLDFGSSGGPVVKDDRVVGVAVAKTIDENGAFVSGLFVPVSEILAGLENANDPSFGYVPQFLQNNPAYQLPTNGTATDADCRKLLGDGGVLADNGGCKCAGGYRKDPTGMACVPASHATSSSSSSALSSSQSLPSLQSLSSSSSQSSRSSSSSRSSQSSQNSSLTSFEKRTCDRVLKWFRGNTKMLDRVNARLQKRFGFLCKA